MKTDSVDAASETLENGGALGLRHLSVKGGGGDVLREEELGDIPAREKRGRCWIGLRGQSWFR